MGVNGSPAQLAALAKARTAAKKPEAVAKQAESLSKTMRGKPRTPAQVEVLNSARAKAHAGMIGNAYGGFRGSFAEFGPDLRERDGDLCQLCLEIIDFDLPVRSQLSRSVDHIIPVRAGGSDDMNNLWLAHTVCNQRNGSRHIGRPDGTTDPRKVS